MTRATQVRPRHFGVRWLAVVVGLAAITWLSIAPAQSLPSVSWLGRHADKVGHFFAYGMLVGIGRWAWFPHWGNRFTFVTLVVGAIIYGTVMELVQTFLIAQGRTCELGDIVANSLGALVFWGGKPRLRSAASAELLPDLHAMTGEELRCGDAPAAFTLQLADDQSLRPARDHEPRFVRPHDFAG